jgi:ribosomal protein L21E
MTDSREPDGFEIGDRVIISPVSPPMRQPHPEHTGKEGTITGKEEMSSFNVPVITLDDGAVLKGYECWWEPVKE